MVKKNFIIVDEVGIHARPASLLTESVKNFDGKANIYFNERKGNLKSIMSIMSLGIKKDSEISIKVDGKEEKTFLAKIEKILNDNNLI